jgi:putative transposase
VPDYRRLRVAGGTYFFTVVLLDRRSELLVAEVAALREAVRVVRRRKPFHIDAWVVLPEHIHCVWTLPEGDSNFSARWWDIKRRFSRALPVAGDREKGRVARGERGIWQQRFWEHAIRDERDYDAHMDYVHFNPVRHGLVARPGDWAWSSFRRCVSQGVYAAEWDGPGEELAEAGEPRDESVMP